MLLFALTLLSAPLPAQEPACITRANAQQLAERPSPLESVTFTVGAAQVKVCYGAPSVRGRKIFGELVPWGQLWRTGANEPTMIHTTAPITVAGVAIPAGVVSLYTVPMENGEWEVVLNRSTQQWGSEGGYEQIKGQEIGRGKAKASTLMAPAEKMTFRADGTTLLLEWERTRLELPLAGTR